MTDRTLPLAAFQRSSRGFSLQASLAKSAVTGCQMPSEVLVEDVPGSGSHRKAPFGRAGETDGSYTPIAPFALSAASELSQDYFVFRTHQIDPVKDTVIAYSRADGEVEAMLLQDGAVKQIYRDPGQPGGWNIHTFPEAAGDVVDMVAGVSAPKVSNGPDPSPTLKVFYRVASYPDVLYVAARVSDDEPTTFVTTTVPWDHGLGPLQIAMNYDDSLLVTAILESSSATTRDAWLALYSDCRSGEADSGPVYGTLTGFSYHSQAADTALSPGWAATITKPWTGASLPQVELALPAGTYGPWSPTASHACLQFPNAGCWSDVSADVSQLSSDAATVEAWINTSATPEATDGQVIYIGHDGDGASPRVSVDADSRIKLYWSNAGSGGRHVSADTRPITDGCWHHVAVVIDQGVITFYKDGQPTIEPGPVTMPTGQRAGSAGQIGAGFGDTTGFVGEIFDLRLWNHARTGDQIRTLMYAAADDTLPAQLTGLKQEGLLLALGFGPTAPVNLVNGAAGDLSGCFIFESYLPVSPSVLPPSVNVWSWVMDTDRLGSSLTTPIQPYHPIQPYQGNLPEPPTETTTAYRVEYANALGSANSATIVVRTLDTCGGDTVQRLWTLSPNIDPPTSWKWNELLLSAPVAASTAMVVSAAVRPLPDSETIHNPVTAARRFLDVFAATDDMLSVVRQAPRGDANLSYNDPVHCPAIPLQSDVAHLSSQPGVSSGDELLLVANDGTLQSLVKDPAVGVWSDHPIHLPATDLEETSTYRLTLVVKDAWDMPVAGHALQLAASSPAAALVSGATLGLGNDPVTVTTDDEGQVDLALLAEGLSTPTLTVAGAGIPTATVNPSDPINSYFQGSSTLNCLPPLTADSLVNAKTPDGQVVAPGASNADAANEAITNMNLAAQQAASPSMLGARQSATLQRRDGQLTGTSEAELEGIFSNIDKWIHDVLHAIKKGVAAVKDAVYDIATKTFTLAVDLAHWAGNVVKIVVKGVEDAAHVIHAFFNKLGADIVNAIKWLAAEVIGTFKDSVALSHQYTDWIAKTCAFLGDQARTDSSKVDAWLASKQAAVEADLTNLANRYGAGTSLATIAQNPPGGLSGRAVPSGRSTVALRGSDDQGSPHSDWFWKKVKNELFGTLTLPPIANVQALIGQLLTAAEQALADFEGAFIDFFDFLKVTITHPSEAMTVGVRDLLLAVSKLVDAVFVLVRAVVGTVLQLLAELADAIPGILNTPLGSAGGIIGALFKLIGLGNISIGTIITTIYAFPTVLAYKIAHNGHGRPFDTATNSLQGGAGDAEKEDLVACASTALGLWAAFDAMSAAQSVAGLSLPLTAVVDIASPIIVGFLTVPAVKDGEPYLSPPVSGDDGDFLAFLSWLTAMIPAGMVAAGEYLEHTGGHDPDLPNQQSMLMFGSSACGVISLATGVQGLIKSEGASGCEYADAILNAIPVIVTAGVDKRMLEATDTISGIVTGVLTLAAGVGGAIAHGETALTV